MPTESPSEPSEPRLSPDVRGALAGVLEPEAAFRGRIAARIEALERAREEREARMRKAPEHLRMAAGLLPGGLAAAGGAGWKLGLKSLPGLLALPAVSLAMVVVTLFGGLRSLARLRTVPGRERESAAARPDPRAVTSAWWQRNRKAAQVALALVVLLALLGHSETALVCVLLSAVAAVLLVGELARAGLTDRRTIGRAMANLLWTLGVYATLWARGYRSVGGVAMLSVLGLGASLCLVASGQLTWRSFLDFLDAPVQRLRHKDLPTVVCLRGLMGLLGVSIAIGAVLAIATIATTFVSRAPSRARLLGFAERFEAPVEDAPRWHRLARVLDLVESDGGPAPRLDAVRGVLAEAIADGRRPAPEVTALAARFELVPMEVLRSWAAGWDPESVLARERPLLEEEASRLQVSSRAGALDPSLARRLAAWLSETWPAPEDRSALSEMRRRTELLDALGHGEEAELHGEAVRAALRAAWPATYRSWRPATGFLADAESARAAPRDYDQDRLSGWKEPTDDALMLLARFGVPEGLDLAPLRRSVASSLVFERVGQLVLGEPEDAAVLELVALRLDGLLPGHHGWLGALMERRLFLALLVLVGLCVAASARGAKAETRA